MRPSESESSTPRAIRNSIVALMRSVNCASFHWQEQLGLDEWVNQPAEAQYGRARHAPVVEEAAGDPRRRRDQVQHVVAEVRKQDRALALADQHVAERVGDALDELHLLAVGDDLLSRRAT
jgi:hypothetical protein